MAGKNKEKLIIVGDGETAEIAYEYFTQDTDYQVAAFSAEKKFIKNKTLYGLPVVPFEDVEKLYSPQNHSAFVAVSFTQLNRLRTRLYQSVKQKGYHICSYISPKAFIGINAQIGENCFILENSCIQREVKVGNNVTFWSGATACHRSVIKDNCFLAAHAAIAGFCIIEEYCFLGMNCCITATTTVAKDTIVGAGAVILHNTEPGKIYVGNPAKPFPKKNAEDYISGVKKL
jgi:sugar O-acyltransferase (sialic acid O-acetyltransferase NeuD family)